jgi:hypothetical protein
MKSCSIEGCNKKASRPNDWCHMHYDRYLRTGSASEGAKDGLWHRIKAELPGECNAIAAKLEVTPEAVRHWIKKRRDATPKQVYVKGWRRPSGKGRFIPIYALGDKPDVECKLEPTPRSVIWQRYRARLQSSGEIDVVRARQLARYYANRAKSKPNTWLGALGIRA